MEPAGQSKLGMEARAYFGFPRSDRLRFIAHTAYTLLSLSCVKRCWWGGRSCVIWLPSEGFLHRLALVCLMCTQEPGLAYKGKPSCGLDSP